MRVARITGDGESYYHLISRVVDRQRLFDDDERERFRRTMRAVEAFCGVQILTYALLGSHWHILLRVPERRPVSDAELIRRLGFLYENTIVSQVAAELEHCRATGQDHRADALKAGYVCRMYDLSQFMKTLKQRVTMSYNRRHGRTGPLWEGRFKSLLVEGSRRALWTVAAYIDLNAVRAGMVDDPAAYRFCGFSEAMAGQTRARDGLVRVMQSVAGKGDWARLGRHYRRLLYARGEHVPGQAKPGIDPERVRHVLEAGGRLSLTEALHCRVRYFSDGMILGSRAFVDDMFIRYRDNFGVRRETGARRMTGSRWKGLYAARRLQLAPVACRSVC